MMLKKCAHELSNYTKSSKSRRHIIIAGCCYICSCTSNRTDDSKSGGHFSNALQLNWAPQLQQCMQLKQPEPLIPSGVSSQDIDARFIDAMALTDDKKATGKPADASNLESLKKIKR